MASRIAWRFKGNSLLNNAAAVTLRKMAFGLFERCTINSEKPVLFPGPGEASATPPFRTCRPAMDSIIAAVNSGLADSYAPSSGIPKARSAVADYLNKNVEAKLTPGDVFITAGCNQAIEVIIEALANPDANILLPRPGYPHYDGRAIYSGLKVLKYNLLPESAWKIDLEGLEAMADCNTVAMVLINPNNPCGNVYSSDHLKQVAEMARKLGIMVISDEVYEHIVYGENRFVPMRKFASIAPVITLGSISKGWLVPGWRIGWMAMNDPEGVLQSKGVVQAIKDCLDLSTQPSLLLQEALPDILEKTPKEFFDLKIEHMKQNVEFSSLPDILEKTPKEFFDLKIEHMKQNVEFSCEKLSHIPCLSFTTKPESCSYLWVKLDTSKLENISDDFDFCSKLVSEENLVLVPGSILGLANWVRITIGTNQPVLEDIFKRLKSFCDHHTAS